MAVPSGSGTETLHSAIFEDVDGTQTLILGVQHHIYIVTSIVIHCNALNSGSDFFYLKMVGYDSHEGTSAQTMTVLKQNISVGETFVWNDRFAFNGSEPTDFSSGGLTVAADQTALAAQGSSTVQYMQADVTHAGDDFDVLVTYIDQDWS